MSTGTPNSTTIRLGFVYCCGVVLAFTAGRLSDGMATQDNWPFLLATTLLIGLGLYGIVRSSAPRS
ncbi:hypothetical protein C483_03994 [Natrialba hulunbeirensis JCM 10989]|uniref:Uncharacterized protein n=1 Tax=Natrialba hulunbeirensis JCM 10989 TaxID=1227493 RepID=M0A8Z3_9EURY|nr:hypothetical protein [Natrialba hulunbeirensis]ELY93808.1 hypothetical protein C483_03994 [Natrialba hulunbeirensis JCM 10989]